ncbi:hypothetical protein JKA74_11630 [Marivirga sp. S37H4]|uniref:Uncharacterized protein n=1 Tax=Marivirga aurantiaca TaxID=2802615 RepID=A0A935C8X6_9BACT|nr:hypothetical protein [Marivirga aurantiaca]MBK6265689.1 hypothetical protein [Marivirga aurantiaca]
MKEIVNQTALYFDLAKSKLNVNIFKVQLPAFTGQRKYIEAHNWLKGKFNLAYYFNSFKNTAFIVGESNLHEKALLEEEFPDCIKALFSYASYQSHNNVQFKSSYKPILLVKASSKNFLSALELDVTHDYKKGSFILLEDHAITFRKVSAMDIYRGELAYIPIQRDNLQYFEQIKPEALIGKSVDVYQKFSSLKYRSQVDFMDTQSRNKYEKSRNSILWNYLKETIDFFETLGLNLKQVSGNFSKVKQHKLTLDTSSEEYHFIDYRHNKDIELPAFLNNSESLNKIIILDYTKEAAIKSGIEDEYKYLKNRYAVSHILNVNSNDSNSSDYFNYEINSEELNMKLEIIENQLLLKGILAGHKSIQHLPDLEIARKYIYVCANDVLYFEDDKIIVESLANSKISDILISAFIEYSGFQKAIPNHIAFMVDRETGNIVMITTLKKKFLYASKTDDFNQREDLKPIQDFYLDDYPEYNQFLETTFAGETSFEDILKYKKEIYPLLKITKSTMLQNKYKMPGKKSNLKLHQGIWFDDDNLEYFCGFEYSMNIKQSNSFAIRRIIPLNGHFVKNEYFQLMNVDFIRSSGSPVLPYPFGLLNIYQIETKNKGADEVR